MLERSAGTIGTKFEQINNFTLSRIPILLVGPTGCGKTTIARGVLAEQLGLQNKEEINDRILQFNLSSETTIDQLIGHLSLDENNNPNFVYGEYAKAFKEGYPLILDEFNLAHEDVLQCIEASLDTEELMVDDPMLGNKPIKMHKDFKLIATQNEAHSEYASKRNVLSTKLLSHFQIIEFDHFKDVELKAICSRCNKNITSEYIDKIIDSYYDITSEDNLNYEFTIRNLKTALLSATDETDIAKSIDYYFTSIAGIQFRDITRQKLSDNNIAINNIPSIDVESTFKEKGITNCWYNPILIDSVNRIQYFLEKDQPILIIGPSGSGKTQIAKWAAKSFCASSLFMVCFPDMTITDLIGNYIPAKVEDTQSLVKWIDGPIIRAATNGQCIILDQIECATPQVIERLNPVLDAYSNVLVKRRDDTVSTAFPVNERYDDFKVDIQPGFKIIATVSREQLKNLSPALINRFTVVEIESQINGSESIPDLINSIWNNPSTPLQNQVITRLSNESKNKPITIIAKILNGLKRLMQKHSIFYNLQIDAYNALAEMYIHNKTPILPRNVCAEFINSIPGSTEKFYFKESPELENIISLVMMMHDIGQPIILQSGTGLGKTSAAVALAKALEFTPYKVSFNGETKLSDLFGNITIKNGLADTTKGHLLRAIKFGGFFIADEANLAQTTLLQSLIVALEQKPGEQIELPHVEETTTVHKDYFFIACQNDTSMFGRKMLPLNLLKRVVTLEFPFPVSSIEKVVRSIADETQAAFITNTISDLVKILHNRFKNEHDFEIRPWSFREVRRFFIRISKKDEINAKLDGKLAPEWVHAACMILLSCEATEKNINHIVEVIKEAFHAPEKKVRDLLTLNAEPDRDFIKKGDVTVTSINPKSKVPKDVASYWNALFFASLIPKDEPLLIIGESSFKSFLAKSISQYGNPVSLNSETTTSSLIGQVSFIHQDSLEKYLLDLLYILSSPNPTIYAHLNEFKKTFTRTDAQLATLRNYTTQLISFIKERTNAGPNEKPFPIPLIEYIHNAIQVRAESSDSQSVFKGYTTAFKPGLITNQILKQNPIILKNFAKPPVAVIERFNELIALEPELTLTEDYTNTITPANQKIIKFNSKDNPNFRIIALCSKMDFNRISEAMRSRFNMIHIKPYTKKEIESIFKQDQVEKIQKIVSETSYLPNYNLSFNDFIKIDMIRKRIFELVKFNHIDLQDDNDIHYAIRLLSNVDDIDEKDLKNPFTIDDDNLMFTKLTGEAIAKMHSSSSLPKTEIVFTKSMQIMTDRIFSALCLSIPIIIEGPNGSGKTEAVEYVIKCFNDIKDLIRISLSRSTTNEDLLGKNGIQTDRNGNKTFDYIPTELFKALTSPNDSIIIIDGIDLASPSLIDSLSAFFDPSISNIMKTNGEYADKGKYKIIGLASSSVPQSIKKNAIYFRNEPLSSTEFDQICFSILMRKLKDEKKANEVLEGFKRYFSKLQQNGITFQRNPRNCYIYAEMDEYFGAQYSNVLFNICCGNINQSDSNWQPIDICHENNGRILKIGDKTLQCYENDNQIENMEAILLTLTPSEQRLFLVLSAIVENRLPLVVCGGTSSGKTYAITKFAKAINKNLSVIQLNADTSISTIIGSYKPSEFISQKNLDPVIVKLNEDEQYSTLLGNLNTDDGVKIQDLLNLKRQVEEIMSQQIDNEKKQIGIDAVNLIDFACKIINNLEFQESALISAMRNGDWVLLDGVESCPSYIMERIVTLLDNKPTLNLFEVGEGTFFSSDPSQHQEPIHSDFRLILTYNNIGTHKKTVLSNSILSRCAVVNMTRIDETTETTSLISLFNIPDVKYNISDQTADRVSVAVRMGEQHIFNRKSETQESNRYELTGRTVIRLCRAFQHLRPGEGQPNVISQKSMINTLTLVYNPDITREYYPAKFLEEPDNKIVEKLKLIARKTHIDFNNLCIGIKQAIFEREKIYDVFRLINRSNFSDIIRFGSSIEDEILKKLIENHQADMNDEIHRFLWVKEYVIMKELLKIIEGLKSLPPEILSNEGNFINPKDNAEKLMKICSRYEYITMVTNTLQSTALPSWLINEEKLEKHDFFTNEFILEMFAHPLIYSIMDSFKSATEHMPQVLADIFESYIKCYQNLKWDAVSAIDEYLKIMISHFNASELQNIDYDTIQKTLSIGELNELIKIRFRSQLQIPQNIKNFISDCIDHLNELQIRNKDEKEWVKLKNSGPQLEEIDSIFKNSKWIPPYHIQSTIVRQITKPPIVKLNIPLNIEADNENKDESNWFQVLVNFSCDCYYMKNLTNPQICFYSLMYLNTREYDVTKIPPTFIEKMFNVPSEIINKLSEEIILKYLKGMTSADYKLIDINNLVERLNKYFNKTEIINDDWKQFILRNNNKVNANLELLLPFYSNSVIIKYATNHLFLSYRKEFETTDLTIDSITKVIQKHTSSRGNKDLDIFNAMKNSKLEKNLIVSDMMKFTGNEKSFLNQAPAEGLFFIKHENVSSIIGQSSDKVDYITYGLFVVRLLSSLKLIKFESTKRNIDRTMMSEINNALFEIIMKKSISDKFIIVSLALEDVPFYLENLYTCILHDSIVQIATFAPNNTEYIDATKQYIGEYLKYLFSEKLDYLDENEWIKFITKHDQKCIIDPISFYVQNYLNQTLRDARNKSATNKIKYQRDLEKGFLEIKQKLVNIQSAMTEDAREFKNLFGTNNQNDKLLALYKDYSEALLSFFKNANQFSWDDHDKQLDKLDSCNQMIQYLKKETLDSGGNPIFNYGNKLTIIYINKVGSNTSVIFENADHSKTCSYKLNKNSDSILKVPDNINPEEIKSPAKITILTLYISPTINPNNIKSSILSDVKNKLSQFLDEYMKHPEDLKETFEIGSQVVFGPDNKTFNDLEQLIEVKINDNLHEHFVAEYTKPHYRGSENVPTKNTLAEIQDLEKKIENYSKTNNLLTNESEKNLHIPAPVAETIIANHSSDFRGIKPEKVNIDFSKTQNKFNMAAINIDGKVATPTFNSLNASVDGVLRGIQTSPIEVLIYCFGDSSVINIDFQPSSSNTPVPTYSRLPNRIILSFSIDNILNDVTFTGTFTINKGDKIPYTVSVTFKDPIIFLESIGNKFYKPDNIIKFSCNFYKKEPIPITTTIPGVKDPKQAILFKNNNSKCPKEPTVSNDGKEINFPEEARLISNIGVEVYNSERLPITISSPNEQVERPVLIYWWDPSQTLYRSDLNSLNAGNMLTEYHVFVLTQMKYSEKLDVSIEASNGIVLEYQVPDIPSSTTPAIDIPFKMKFSNYEKNKIYKLTLNINSHQFKLNKSIDVKIAPLKLYRDKVTGDYVNNNIPTDVAISAFGYRLSNIKSPQIERVNNLFLPISREPFNSINLRTLREERDFQPHSIMDSPELLADYFVGFKFYEPKCWWPLKPVEELKSMLGAIKKFNSNQINDFLQVFGKLVGSEPIKNLRNKMNNYRDNETKALEVYQFTIKSIEDRYAEIERNDFQTYISNDFKFEDVFARRMTLLNKPPRSAEVQKKAYDKLREISKMKDESGNAKPVIAMRYKFDNDELVGRMELIEMNEKENEVKKLLSQLTAPTLEIQMNKIQEAFDINKPNWISQKSAKDFYDIITRMATRVKKFILAMSTFSDYSSSFPSNEASTELNTLYSFFKWSSDELVLKYTPFISLLEDFNSSFKSLIRLLIDSDTDVGEMTNCSGEILINIKAPEQPSPNVYQFKTQWRIQKKNSTNLQYPSTSKRVSITLNSQNEKNRKESVAPKKQDTGGNLGEGANATMIPIRKTGGTNRGIGSGKKLADPSDIYKFLLDKMDKVTNHDANDNGGEEMNFSEFEKMNSDVNISADNLELPVKPFIDYAIPIAANIVQYAKRENENVSIIPTEAVLLLDINSLSDPDVKANNLLLFCAYAIALAQLQIPSRLAVFADYVFKYFEIKDILTPLSPKHLQMALEAFKLSRHVSEPISSINKIIRKYRSQFNSFSFFIFTDGVLVNTAPQIWDNWQNGTISKISFVITTPDESKAKLLPHYRNIHNKNPEISADFMEIGVFEDSQAEFFYEGLAHGQNPNISNDKVPLLLHKGEQNAQKLRFDKIFSDESDRDQRYYCIDNSHISTVCKMPEVEIEDANEYLPTIKEKLKNIFAKEEFEQSLPKVATDINSFFTPNKPTQATASESGYGLSITGLIRYILTNSQDKRIYLEKNAGYISNYSMFIIIDCGESCSSFLSIRHTRISVIATLLRMQNLDMPVTIIAATSEGPTALCINAKISEIIGENANGGVLQSIYSTINKSVGSVSLAKAFLAAYNIRCRQQEQGSILFAFTNGTLSADDFNAISSISAEFSMMKTDIIGVGVGIAPINIRKIFSKSVWSQNPFNTPQAIYELLASDQDVSVEHNKIAIPSYQYKLDHKALVNLMNNSDLIYMKIHQKLDQIRMSDMTADFYENENQLMNYSDKTTRGKANATDEHLKFKDLGRNEKWPFKILLVQLYDYTCRKTNPDPRSVRYETIEKGFINSIKGLGFTIDVVQNYWAAICALTSGEFHQVWIICSEGSVSKPHDCKSKWSRYSKRDSEDFQHAYQFVETVEQFRRLGGGVAWWADQGFSFELEYYLNNITLLVGDSIDKFADKDKLERQDVKFTFSHSDPTRDHILKRVSRDSAVKCSFFDCDKELIANYEHRIYSYNVANLSEGATIAGEDCTDCHTYQEIKEKIAPFIPFSISTNGLVSGMYYVAPRYSYEGDIIIDGASSRLFAGFNEEGVGRLVRNMAVVLVNRWRAESENNTTLEQLSKKFVPKFVIPPLPEQIPHEKIIKKDVDLTFIFDASFSTEPIKMAIEELIKRIIEDFNNNKGLSNRIRLSAIAFRDKAMAKLIHKLAQDDKSKTPVEIKKLQSAIDRNRSEVFDFVDYTDSESLITNIHNTETIGGMGDGPEDWVDAFKKYKKLSFNENAKKVIFFITDNGGHSKRLHNKKNKPDPQDIDPQDIYAGYRDFTKETEIIDEQEEPKLMELLEWLRKQQAYLMFCAFTRSAIIGCSKFSFIYSKEGNTNALARSDYICHEEDFNYERSPKYTPLFFNKGDVEAIRTHLLNAIGKVTML